MTALLLLVGGLAALLVGAELVVRSATDLAERFGIPSIVIGLTVVSIGTSAPELAVGINSGIEGVGELSVGNVAGTNIVNLLLILGLTTLIRPFAVRRATFRVDLPMMVLAAVVLILLSLDRRLSTIDGIVLLLVAVAYTAVVVRGAIRDRGADQPTDPGRLAEELAHDHHAPSEHPQRSRRPAAVAVQAALLVAGIVIIVAGAEWLVDGAVDLARLVGASDAFIGLTVVAIGTSAPELATTIVSTVRGGDRNGQTVLVAASSN